MRNNEVDIPGVDANALRIAPDLSIHRGELATRATRSSGAGGQHVNKTSSRIELTWNVRQSPSLTDDQRARLLIKLKSRITTDGVIRIVASTTRSQFRNRAVAELRLAKLLAEALKPVKKRRVTKPSRAAKEARIAEKKKHSIRKQERRAPVDD